ncbi:MAG TPA: efflux transporter outer membrane subunit [Terriglobales bacterium]|nr:efflux transporter outer membrane subunit [Terriglobales bacterium]
MKLRVALLLLLCSSAFAKGPKYAPPTVATPPSWQTPAPWQQAVPLDSLPKGAWWEFFGDTELNQYEQRALANNQTLQAAIARLSEARASARVTSSGLYPELDGGIRATRARLAGNRPTNGALIPPRAVTQNEFTIPFTLNYEIDLFGRVRHNVEAANADLQASAADLENVRLLVTSELAADYFQVRELDSEIAVVQKAITYQQQALTLVQNRHTGGAASGLDVAQQQEVLDSSITQLSLLQQQRSQYQHALAMLQGLPPAQFVAPVRGLETQPPALPLILPSEVLQRRPDIATAERDTAAANARIGVARAALYPSITLGGSGGLDSHAISDLFNAPSFFWSLGLSALEPVIAGGRNRAQLEFARSTYQETVAIYRETALTAFQQVEDALSGLTTLAAAYQSQQRAVEDAERSLQLANARYTGGLVTYLDVITAQEQALTNERQEVQLLGQRMTTSVYLVKAIGGGWDSSSLSAIGIKPSLRQAVQQ